MVELAERDMAKAKRGKGRPKTSERDDVSVKMNRAVVGKAKAIAVYRGISIAELLTDMVETLVDKAYGQMLREIDAKEDKP